MPSDPRTYKKPSSSLEQRDWDWNWICEPAREADLLPKDSDPDMENLTDVGTHIHITDLRVCLVLGELGRGRRGARAVAGKPSQRERAAEDDFFFNFNTF